MAISIGKPVVFFTVLSLKGIKAAVVKFEKSCVLWRKNAIKWYEMLTFVSIFLENVVYVYLRWYKLDMLNYKFTGVSINNVQRFRNGWLFYNALCAWKDCRLLSITEIVSKSVKQQCESKCVPKAETKDGATCGLSGRKLLSPVPPPRAPGLLTATWRSYDELSWLHLFHRLIKSLEIRVWSFRPWRHVTSFYVACWSWPHNQVVEELESMNFFLQNLIASSVRYHYRRILNCPSIRVQNQQSVKSERNRF